MLQKLRFVGCILIFALFTIILASSSIVHGVILTLLTGKTRHLNNTRLWGKIMTHCMALLIRTKVVVYEGAEHLEKDTSCVFVSNHQSSLDMLAMMGMWPKNTAVVAKRAILFMPVFGIASYLNGTVMINRKDGAGSRQQLNEVFNDMLPRKERIWLFPEGTRNRTSDDMLPFKKGAFHMAVAAQVPIVPIVFSSISDFYSRSELRWNAGTIGVGVLPPVPTVGLSKDDLPELMQSVSKQMQEMLLKLNAAKQQQR